MQLLPPPPLLALILGKMVCNVVCSLGGYASSSVTYESTANRVSWKTRKQQVRKCTHSTKNLAHSPESKVFTFLEATSNIRDFTVNVLN